MFHGLEFVYVINCLLFFIIQNVLLKCFNYQKNRHEKVSYIKKTTKESQKTKNISGKIRGECLRMFTITKKNQATFRLLM